MRENVPADDGLVGEALGPASARLAALNVAVHM
jgi:hypothetical protein